MSKYTTEVKFICETSAGLTESVGLSSVDDVISKAVGKVFDFDFPLFDESYRTTLETKILKHYYTREIAEETVGLWKFRLQTKLNEIMPYYNKLYNSELLDFNPLYTSNITRKHDGTGSSDRDTNENISDTTTGTRESETDYNGTRETKGNVDSSNTGSVNDTTSGTNNNTNYDLYSDTPQGALSGVEAQSYLTNARKVTDSATSSGTSNSNSSNTGKVESDEDETNKSNSTTDENTSGTYKRTRGNKEGITSTESYLETVMGYEGKDASELLEKYRKTFLNIDMMVINELEVCFFQLW